jgi:hypothetical protein
MQLILSGGVFLMPHIVVRGQLTGDALEVPSAVYRWGRAVLKTGDCWLRKDGSALLVEGVVVESSRPLLPVAVVTAHYENTIIRLWPPASVERTHAVQRWLAHIVVELQGNGAGDVISSNLPEVVTEGLILKYEAIGED